MQIWTNESNVNKMSLEYEFNNGKLLPAGGNWLIDHPLATIVNNKDKDQYEISLEGKKIKLDYAEAHHVFLLLLMENDTRVKLLDATVVKSI